MKRLLLIIMVLIIYVLHQDFWFWRAVRPLVLGFLPIGLFYHICYTLVVAGVMWVLVTQAWPSELEAQLETEERMQEDDENEENDPDYVGGGEVSLLRQRVAKSPFASCCFGRA